MAVICLIWCVSILLALPYAVHMRTAKGGLAPGMLSGFHNLHSNSPIVVKWPCNFSLCVEDWIGREDLRSVYGVITVLLQVRLLHLVRRNLFKNFLKLF